MSVWRTWSDLLADIGDRRLLPSMSLHEFEAIAFVSPTTVAEVVEGQGSPAAGDLEAIAEVGVTHHASVLIWGGYDGRAS